MRAYVIHDRGNFEHILEYFRHRMNRHDQNDWESEKEKNIDRSTVVSVDPFTLSKISKSSVNLT